jgi:sugar phosphate isomerase/epimerase
MTRSTDGGHPAPLRAVQLAAVGQELSYCTNIHPGESLAEVERALATHTAAVRERLGVERFAVGLRLSAQAAQQLDTPDALARLRDLLTEHRLYLFTLNGFPYGAFHATRVKEQVYQPDWRDESRLHYTTRLARLLCALLPEGQQGSISTVPLGFRPTLSPSNEPHLSEQLLRQCAALHELHRSTGHHVALGLEPEPHCYLETLGEAADFLERGPFSQQGVNRFAAITGQTIGAAETTLRSHLGVCLDACHMAVEFEPPRETLAMLRSRGIAISKLQISAGLRGSLNGQREHDAQVVAALRALRDDVYLHQVVERRDGALHRYLDLPQALTALGEAHSVHDCELRVHFHVPIYLEQLEHLHSTQQELRQLLAEQRRTPFTHHLEVETYTWDVLPRAARQTPLVEAIAREIEWASSELRAT